MRCAPTASARAGMSLSFGKCSDENYQHESGLCPYGRKRGLAVGRVRERGANKETELCRVKTNPEAVMAAAQEKRLLIDVGKGRKVRVPKYEHVHVVELK